LLISIPIIGGIYLDNFVKSDIKKAHKEELNDYIRVVQEYANNLAFRLFLLSYNNKQNKKNINFKEAREKQQRIREKFIEVATPYIPLYRVQILLQNIINIEDINALHDLKSEIKFIMEENYLNFLNHNQLKDELLLLGVALSIAIKDGPHSSDRLLTSLLKKRTQIVLEKYNKYVREREVKVKKSRPSYELVKIIDQKEVTLKEVLAFIDGEQLPNEAKLKLYDLAKQYFVMKDIIDGKYIPSEEIKIPRLLDKEGRVQIRVNRILSQLEINIRSREGIVAQETKAYTELKTLTTEYKQLLQQVKTHMKNIKRALADAQINVPDSLRSDYDKSNKEFETVLEAYKQMDERLSQISTRLLNQQLSNNRIDQMFIPEDNIVKDSFIEIFSNYVNNRHSLKEKLIVAIENGEKGEDLQRSVISIYGKGSGGVKPILGSRSVYVQLQEVVLKIAKIESDIVDYSRQIVELTMEYNNLLRTLISLMPEALSTKPEIKRLIRAAGINNPEIIYMQDVLAGFFVAGSKELEDKNSVIEYIKAHNTMFSAALKQWNKLISRLPDDLPTEQ